MIVLDLTRCGYSFTLTKIPDARLQDVMDRVAAEYGDGTALDMAEGARIFAKHGESPAPGPAKVKESRGR